MCPALRLFRPAPLLLALSLFTGFARAADDGTGRPYLKAPAATSAALWTQVNGDPQLTARYAKHFNVAPSRALQALKGARPITLPPGRYTVWLTGRYGLRYPTVQDRATPTRAFVVELPFRNDTVSWLEQGTGNPVQLFRPVEEIEIVTEARVERVEQPPAPREVLVPVAAPTGDADAEKKQDAPGNSGAPTGA